jgi:hypothetical protein
MTDLEQLAAQLYAAGVQERGPAWDQLGEVTRSVWIARAQAALFGDLA